MLVSGDQTSGRTETHAWLRVLSLAVVLGVVAAGCSGGEDSTAGRDAGAESGGKTTGAVASPVEDDLGHQAYMQPTRLVVPVAGDDPLNRVARVVAGLTEARLGTTIFATERPGDGGLLAWRDVANQEPDGHQLAYVTEGLLALDGSEVGPDDFEMVAQTDSGSAVLVVGKDPEAESFQVSLGDFGDLVAAAKEDPGFVEVADSGPNTVYRAGTLKLEKRRG